MLKPAKPGMNYFSRRKFAASIIKRTGPPKEALN
jgi:hypothetical protein